MSVAEQLGPHVVRLPLPTATLPPHDHVNTYLIVSNGVAAVVDPGSTEAGSAERVVEALEARDVRLVKAILLTHSHPDHVAGLEPLLAAVDRPATYLHPAEAARLDHPTTALDDGRRLTVGDVVVRAIHTPGHSPGHLAFALEGHDLTGADVVLAGDLVAGSGSIWVGVPEGDVAAYLRSLDRLRALAPGLLGPGHGPPPGDPDAALAGAAAHRRARETQLLQRLAHGDATLGELRASLYPDLAPAAAPLAEASLLAHLAKLMHEMRVLHLGEDERGPYALRR